MGLIKNICLGSDPEFFLKSKENNEVISSIGLIGGTKDVPKSLGEEGYYVQEDNVLVEFNIPIARTAKELVYNINHGLRLVNKLIPNEYYTARCASAYLDQKWLNNKKALEFGWR